MTEILGEDVFAVHRAFAQTDHGQTLADKIRYERYNLAQLPNEEWVRLLGADVNNLTHMPLTQGLAKSFIRTTEQEQPGYFSEEEQTLLQLAAIIHDQGEAIVGDITFGDKTSDDEAEEKRQFESNLEAFCPGATEEMKKLIVRARDEVVFDPTTKLGRVFNAIERTGYVRTALRASEHLHAGTAGNSARGLEWIIADVLSNQPVQLIAYAREYPAVEKYLRAQSTKIADAFEYVEPEIFDLYGFKAQEKRDQFVTAYRSWRADYATTMQPDFDLEPVDELLVNLLMHKPGTVTAEDLVGNVEFVYGVPHGQFRYLLTLAQDLIDSDVESYQK